jgi:RNA polymerase sigma-70 factor (ECF subfamily)
MLDLERMDARVDPGAFFERFYPSLYAFVWTQVGGPHADVEEIVQDTLLHAWRDRERFRQDASPLTWLRAIARHRLLEHRRKAGRRERADAVIRALERIDAALLPEDTLRTGELRAAVWRALETIGPDYAELLVRRYLDDRSLEEIARELGESEKAVESRLHRAREAFRVAIQRGGDDEARS